MCGILGVSNSLIARTGSSADLENRFRNLFAASLSLLDHRGPDASGMEAFPDAGVCLGHTRLAIQDLSSYGAQPMMSRDKKIAITFNGELYNFPALKISLLDLGYVFTSNSDTEVIINLYAEFGLDCLAMLDGIFALAIFDNVTNNLILARDGIGVKPLYYYHDENSFIFSSEIKAIEKLVFNKHLSLDKSSLNRYLTFQWCPGEGTPFNEIKKHNPGEALVIKNGEVIDRKIFFSYRLLDQLSKLVK